ncbi:MAG TPA: hypothetical protein VFG42_08740 [Baekduia sp.]|uniref:hypothetical protein n=1 Tax=Baekduia sp. TaxID=2600305 RepID=UPI002D788295|nr:hypothetical protein [Baekduia sp.]HET6506863.1 hypothetical protein [Baekduia sp.]
MAIDRARTARGALAGAVAAGVWVAQQPLDQKVFGVRYDDTELLGKAVTRRDPAWRVVGTAMHLANGAVFGAVYANVARRAPLPSWLRGPAAGLGEHVAAWPLVVVTDRVHPARDELPTLGTSAAAFAQATWRHLLFGFVLGELERRLNAEEDEELPSYEHVVSTNGHGNIDHAITGAA